MENKERWKKQPKYRQVQGGAKRLGCMVGGNGKIGNCKRKLKLDGEHLGYLFWTFGLYLVGSGEPWKVIKQESDTIRLPI